MDFKGQIIKYSFVTTNWSTLLIGDWTEHHTVIFKTLFLHFNPIILTQKDENFLLKSRERIRKVILITEDLIKKKTFRATNVVIISTSYQNFKIILVDLFLSPYWNHKVNFLIVNDDPLNGCQLAEDFLKALWGYNILLAIYLCRDMHSKLRVYSFNPYKVMAPKFWNVIKRSNVSSNHWTLLEHQFEELDKTQLSRKKEVSKLL